MFETGATVLYKGRLYEVASHGSDSKYYFKGHGSKLIVDAKELGYATECVDDSVRLYKIPSIESYYLLVGTKSFEEYLYDNFNIDASNLNGCISSGYRGFKVKYKGQTASIMNFTTPKESTLLFITRMNRLIKRIKNGDYD